ncbi:MAG: tetratricopeptide repeat protein [Salibacteraceae bacterium]
MRIALPTFLLIFFFLPLTNFAQKNKKGNQEEVHPNFPYRIDDRVKFRPDTINLEPNIQFAFREPVEEPEFIYGKQEMDRFFDEVSNSDQPKKPDDLQDSVRVQFLVSTQGRLTNITLEDELRDECVDEIVRIVQVTEGLWEYDSTRLAPDTVFLTLPLKVCWSCYNNKNERGQVRSVSQLRLSPKRYNELGLEKTREGKDKLAILYFDEAIRLDPTFVDAYFNRGVAKFNSDDTAGACADWLSGTYMGDPKSDLYQQQYCR